MTEDPEGKVILVIQTHGVETPRRTYSPLFYAMAAWAGGPWSPWSLALSWNVGALRAPSPGAPDGWAKRRGPA